ncbi:helix-turn-helix domain-containing protein [Chitinophaga nivalis]|uniref:Helix-turn-helix domain-containing protein n=1 Tax=Chitinophaga nivalis TaxID=2991709 RepID=A0ABT3IQ91_9BACT|nr:helix-turn-helix domain-containing protein [Chitinophaga nivalis]MCW3464189.1 helix-turn-helix domain-containing protein [Chitinophaga nivalis]MCW3486121.1 helix-turn-helix domain-containing protein [Chitinophaga nivalis]
MWHNDKIVIKEMVDESCLQAVKQLLAVLQIPVKQLYPGLVILRSALTAQEMQNLTARLAAQGYHPEPDKTAQMVLAVKALVATVYGGTFPFTAGFLFGPWAQEQLGEDYPHAARLFAATTGMTPENYILHYRIEKIKEWLVYTDDSVAAIAARLGFKHAVQLSAQLKAYTGLNTAYFRKIRHDKALLRARSSSGT